MTTQFKPIPKLSEKDIKKFWSKVIIRTKAECWTWNTQDKHYGNIYINHENYLTHRVAWYLANKTQPGNFLICHTCDNPKCVNPQHLFLGTQQDNHNDAIRKGRAINNQGSKHGRAKLTENDIQTIHLLRTQGHSQKYIAKNFHVVQSTISRIIGHLRWKHITSK